MKKINLLFIAAVAVGLMQACSGSKASTSSDSSSSTSDSSKTTSDSPKTTVSVKADSSTTVLSDTIFATKAAVSGMAEVALGKIAAEKGTDSSIKNFGKMMVMDHGKANAELMSIAKSKNIMLPAGLDAEHQTQSDSLGRENGKDFDRAYARMMIAGHQKTLTLMQSEASSGKDRELKAFAAKTAPIVKAHLAEIKKIQSSLK